MCSILQLRNANNPFLDWIVTCDEKCILYGNRKRSALWHDHDKWPEHYPKPELNQLWWLIGCSAIGGVHYSILESIHIITANVYRQQLGEMHISLSKSLVNQFCFRTILLFGNMLSGWHYRNSWTWDMRPFHTHHIRQISYPMTTTFSSILIFF